jgi:hypothetical protein
MTERVLGRTGAKKRRTRLLGLTTMMAALFAALFVTAAGAILTGSPSNFESNDGNMVASGTNNDWDSVNFTAVDDVFKSGSDDSFTPGQKQDTTCPGVEGHQNPPKDDFTAVASFVEVNESGGANDGDTYLYGATIRVAANGNASENVELKTGTTPCPDSDLVARSAGDKLIAIDYLNGGTNVQFHVLTWVTSGACFVGSHTAPCWGEDVLELNQSGAEGLASQSNIAADDNPINGVALKAGEFAEFGINLAVADIVPSGQCAVFTQTVWESRASGSSFVSTTKDITIEDKAINNCPGAIRILKNSAKGDGDTAVSTAGAVFSYDGSSVTDNGTGDEDTTIGVVCVSGLAADTEFTINETSPPDGYGDAPASEDDQTVTAEAGTDCDESLPDADGTATFTNPPLADLLIQVEDAGSHEVSSTIDCDPPFDVVGPTDPGETATLDEDDIAAVPQSVIECTITIDP